MDKIIDDLKGFANSGEARKYLEQFPKKERIKHIASILRHAELPHIPYIKEWNGRSHPEAFNILLTDNVDAPPTDLEEAKKLYTYLFEQIATKLQETKESKKPFQLVNGEIHTERSSLLVQLMVIRIAARLGIQQINFEWPRDSNTDPSITKDGREIALRGLTDRIEQFSGIPKNTILPESDTMFSMQPDAIRLNNNYLLHHAIHHFPNMKISAIDPDGFQISYTESLMDQRDQRMTEILSNQEVDSISFVGASHLPGMKELDPHLITLQANNSWIIYQTDKEENDISAKGVEHWADINPWTSGPGLERAKDAVLLAEAADRALGSKLLREFSMPSSAVTREAAHPRTANARGGR